MPCIYSRWREYLAIAPARLRSSMTRLLTFSLCAATLAVGMTLHALSPARAIQLNNNKIPPPGALATTQDRFRPVTKLGAHRTDTSATKPVKAIKVDRTTGTGGVTTGAATK